MRNRIMLPKLFWPTVRKHCSSDQEKHLKFEAESREFEKFLRFFLTVGQNNFGNNIPYSCKFKHGKRFWTPMKISLAGIPKVCLKRTPWRLLKACLKFWHILNAHCSPLAMFFESDFDMGEKRGIALVYGNWQRVFYPFTHERERT